MKNPSYYSENLAITSSMMAQVRHDLRTPINAIIGYSEMLIEELEAEAVVTNTDLMIKDELKQLKNDGNLLLAIVNQVFRGSEPEQNFKLTARNFELEVSQLLQEVKTRCDRLLSQIATELVPDIQKIEAANQNLLTLFDNLEPYLRKSNYLNQYSADQSHQHQSLTDFTLALPPASTQSFAEEVYGGFKQAESNSNSKSQVLSTIASPSSQILIVDDNRHNRDLLGRYLEKEAHIIDKAVDGKQAINLIVSGKYDLILLDVLMPEINGYQVLEWLRQSKWSYIPVIMISALDEIDSVVKCIEMGAEDYLAKPFNPVLLRARINACLEKKHLRDQEAKYLEQLSNANEQIIKLNEQLQAENLRLNAEIELTRRIQQMILPKEQELQTITDLDIAGFMEPAEQVGGDYYDILQHNGLIKIGIGDVTGHGLESGVLMLMVQTAVRTLTEVNPIEPVQFLDLLNRTIYQNIQRINSDKNLTLCLLDYAHGKITISGQHEEVIIIRNDGNLEMIDTIDLGFPIGLEPEITNFIAQTEVHLNIEDILVLYTDGITEAENSLGELYGIERLCNLINQNRRLSAEQIRKNVIQDIRQYIGSQTIYDDLTLLIIKRKK